MLIIWEIEIKQEEKLINELTNVVVDNEDIDIVLIPI